MKCSFCEKPVTKTEIKYGDSYKSNDGTFFHADCALDGKNWGGKREGAGRKPAPEPIEQMTITFHASHLEYLCTIDPSPSIAIRKLIEKSRPKK